MTFCSNLVDSIEEEKGEALCCDCLEACVDKSQVISLHFANVVFVFQIRGRNQTQL